MRKWATLGEQAGDAYNISDANGEFIGYVMQKNRLSIILNHGLHRWISLHRFSCWALVSLLGATLIICYKQYSEGHEDKKSYKILQEVGMSQQTVKKTSQLSNTLGLYATGYGDPALCRRLGYAQADAMMFGVFLPA